LVTIELPAAESTIRGLRAGDTVSLSGSLFGIRDATQIRMFDQGVAPPVDLSGHFCIHTAPNVKRLPGGRYEKISIGTTTSTRMERFSPLLISRCGVRGIIGKGGLLEASTRAMAEYGACYFSIVGGAAALETEQIEEIEAVYWEDLMPECLWKFRVKEFGPLLVSIDSHGRNLYSEVKAAAKQKLDDMLKGKPEPGPQGL
jgi:L(+)-tartrate dehydratase beta subunit